jgi:formylglycine-generating enzyme required for sulfatase activity
MVAAAAGPYFRTDSPQRPEAFAVAPSPTPATEPDPAPALAEIAAEPLLWPFDERTAKAGQLAWAKKLGRDVVEKNGIGIELVVIPPGTFTMGSSPDEANRFDDEPEVSMTLTRAFQMSRMEVAQGQWQAVMGTEPWKGQRFVRAGEDYPATYVSWNDAVEFCRRLSAREGRSYRLPAEAEWEWACRAGSPTAWSFGGSEGDLGRYAWYAGNASQVKDPYAHRVGQKLPNGFGLSDMHGNVWEWCEDGYGRRHCFEIGGVSNSVEVSGGAVRVFRGGGWSSKIPTLFRSAFRFGSVPTDRDSEIGFRLVLSLSD